MLNTIIGLSVKWNFPDGCQRDNWQGLLLVIPIVFLLKILLTTGTIIGVLASCFLIFLKYPDVFKFPVKCRICFVLTCHYSNVPALMVVACAPSTAVAGVGSAFCFGRTLLFPMGQYRYCGVYKEQRQYPVATLWSHTCVNPKEHNFLPGRHWLMLPIST